MENICADNFIRIFSEFENRLNAVFQKNTKSLQGGNVRNPKKAVWYQYKKRFVTLPDNFFRLLCGNRHKTACKAVLLFYSKTIFQIVSKSGVLK